MSSSCPATSENSGHDGVKIAKQEGRRSVKNVDPLVMGSRGGNGGPRRSRDDDQAGGPQQRQKRGPLVMGSRRRGSSGLFALSSDGNGTLLVVATLITTLITTLSYQVGSNIPGGYWQEDELGHYFAGEPIMRMQRRLLYMVFMWSSWAGFAASMGLTLALVTGFPPRSRFVRGLFVLSYSTLILSFTTQKYYSFFWLSLLIWVAVAALIASVVNHRTHRLIRKLIDWLRWEPVAQTS